MAQGPQLNKSRRISTASNQVAATLTPRFVKESDS
jgi:hypothetical protein